MATVSGSLDTNLLLRWLLDDVPAQAKQVEGMLSRGVLYRVSDLAVSEIVYVLDEGLEFTREEIGIQLALLLGHSAIVCNRLQLSRAIDRYLVHSSLSFVDSYLAEEAQLAHGLPLYTFDRKLAKQSDGLASLVY